jgi:hypothetical protein
MRHIIDRLNTKPLVRYIRAVDPHITVSGIPIDPVFGECVLPGIDPTKPILLLSADALGVCATDFILEQPLLLSHRAQILVVCGRDEELRRGVEQRLTIAETIQIP